MFQETDVTVVSTSQEEVVVMWYHKLGRMLERGLKILMEHNLLPKLKDVVLPFYKHCVISNQHILKFASY